MLNKELIQKVMESNSISTDELFREAMEGATAIAAVRDVAREEGEVTVISKFCDSCCYLRLLPDPDPYDWFEQNNMKAVCLSMKAVIEGSLGTGETTNIQKPLYCPKLGRELTKKEIEEAATRLKWSQERWIKEVK